MLVLDNCHEAEADAFHQVLREFIQECPRGINLFLISRNREPVSFSKLIANQDVGLVGWDEIQLTREETEAVATAVGRTPYSNIQNMVSRTDGWAAGVVLMALLFGLHSFPGGLVSQVLSAALNLGVRSELSAQLIGLLGLAVPQESAKSWPWPARITTLGTFQVSIQGQPLVFTGRTHRKVIQLLRAVVAFGGSQVPFHRLADAL